MNHLEKIIHAYSKPIFGYSLNKVRNRQEAEDLAQDILYQVIKSYSSNSEIKDQDSYVWSIARYTWANWIRKKTNSPQHLDLNGMSDLLQDDNPNPLDQLLKDDAFQIMRREITYLSKMQRQIVIMYYYKSIPQKDIANALNLPVGTVKWHLHDAKKEMKKGMEMMRSNGELSFNPIQLEHFGHSGSPGQLGETTHFIRRTLTQNICYAMYKKPLSINELANELGTPPMFLEDEVKYLVDYEFIKEVNSKKYQTNFIIWNHTPDQLNAYDKVYKEYSSQIADIHFDALMDVRKEIEETSLYYPDRDYNFLLWTLLPKDIDDQGNRTSTSRSRNSIVVPIRKDGGKYIAFANLKSTEDMKLTFDPKFFQHCGPMTRSQGGSLYVWQFNTYWSNRVMGWHDLSFKDAQLCHQFISGELPEDENHYEDYAFLLAKDYILKKDDHFQFNLVWMGTPDVAKQINTIIPDLSKLYEPLASKLYEELLRIAMINQPQHIESQVAHMVKGNATGGFLTPYILKHLIEKGKLHEPLEHQKKTITTLMGLIK